MTESKREIIHPELSLSPEKEASASNFQRELLMDEMELLPELEKSSIDIRGDYIFDMGDEVEVSFFIRNGLSKPVDFKKVILLLTNSKHELLAKQIFDLEDIGQIPAYAGRPCKVRFNKKNIYVKDIDKDDWIIAFETNKMKTDRNVNIELENVPEELSKEDLVNIKEYMKTLPRTVLGNMSINCFRARKNNKGDLLITILVRNGGNNPAKISKLPITILDKNKNTVVSGIFNLNEIIINPFKAQIINLAFASNVLKAGVDLSETTVNFSVQS